MHYIGKLGKYCFKLHIDWYIVNVTQPPVAVLLAFSLEIHLCMRMPIYEELHLSCIYIVVRVITHIHKHH